MDIGERLLGLFPGKYLPTLQTRSLEEFTASLREGQAQVVLTPSDQIIYRRSSNPEIHRYMYNYYLDLDSVAQNERKMRHRQNLGNLEYQTGIPEWKLERLKREASLRTMISTMEIAGRIKGALPQIEIVVNSYTGPLSEERILEILAEAQALSIKAWD